MARARRRGRLHLARRVDGVAGERTGARDRPPGGRAGRGGPLLGRRAEPPPQLPPGTVARAVAELDGCVVAGEVGVDARRGMHAFLHADARLPLENDPKGAAMTAREATRLGAVFPWVCGCPSDVPGPDGDDDLDAMLREFDIDPADLNEALLGAFRK